MASSAVAKNNSLTLEQRMEQLEARLAAAESRATVAEGQVRELQEKQRTAIALAQPPVAVKASRRSRRAKRILPRRSLSSPAMAI